MSSSSVNDKLERVRKPRVHIKYEVETEGASVEKELPFVVGVMGDFSGESDTEKKSLKDRKFVKIDRDNFNQVMHQIDPGVKLRVDNTLANDGSEMAVNLSFHSMDDFEPANIVEKVPELKQLKAARDKLRDLLAKADRSDKLEKILENVLQDTEALNQLAAELEKSDSSTD